jgi:excisionase family DNA binding protein
VDENQPQHRRTGAHAAEPNWLTLGQAAKYLGIAQSTVRVWTDSGRLPVFYTPGGHRRFKEEDLHAFMSRNGAGSRPRNAATVLIVDDDPRLREVIRVNLEYDGMIVREAGNADEGLRALDGELPDLVMLDVMMPGLDGWQMLQRVREKHGIETLPVVMFSGKVDDGEGAAERGASAFVGKPLDPLALVEQAKALLRVRVTQFG